jgi:DNA-binding NarL/FixJ family response regulator
LTHSEPLICAGLNVALKACSDFDVHMITEEPIWERPVLRTMDVVLADCDNGIRLAQASRSSGVRVLIVTADDSEVSIMRAMNAGVRGYLLLSATLESVVQAVRSVVRGGSAIDPHAATRMLESLNAEKLTHRELEVLRLLMRGMRNKDISSRLGISVGTTKSHAKHLLSKLKGDVANRSGCYWAAAWTTAAGVAASPGGPRRVPPSRHLARPHSFGAGLIRSATNTISQ